MGLFRLLLALAVLTAHAGHIKGFYSLGGDIAVEAFFIISGFYMSLILNEKYIGAKGNNLFLTNRFLKLYPVYWGVLLLTVGYSFVISLSSPDQHTNRLTPFIEYCHQLSVPSFLYLILTNVIIFFQDFVLFLGVNLKNGGLYFLTNFRDSTPATHHFLLIPQAWSISLELYFYLLAPFILRKSLRFISVLIVLALGVKIFLFSVQLNYDPWTYRFFPAEILYFLLGNISYRMMTKIKNYQLSQKILLSVFIIQLLFTVFYQRIPLPHKEYIYLASTFLVIPFIFLYTKKSSIDRWVGELSYPIYLTHILVLAAITDIAIIPTNLIAISTAFFSFGLSIMLNKFILKPIDNYRQKRVKIIGRLKTGFIKHPQLSYNRQTSN